MTIDRDLTRSVKIIQLGRILGRCRHAALGLAASWVMWMTENADAEGGTHRTPTELDNEIGYPGCTSAMCKIGWAKMSPGGHVTARAYQHFCHLQ